LFSQGYKSSIEKVLIAVLFAQNAQPESRIKVKKQL